MDNGEGHGRRPTVALAVSTIGRPAVVQRFIRSVRQYFPDLPIYVAEQSLHVDEMTPFYEANDVRVVRMPFDAGICASRNRLVDEIVEDYFVVCDDDFEFWPETDFTDALAILENRPDIAIVGGRLSYTEHIEEILDQHWEMYFEYDRKNRVFMAVPIINFSPVRHFLRDIEFFLCDAVLNFAVFRRSIFNDVVRWDEQFKSNGEHEDFYLNLKVNTSHKVRERKATTRGSARDPKGGGGSSQSGTSTSTSK